MWEGGRVPAERAARRETRGGAGSSSRTRGAPGRLPYTQTSDLPPPGRCLGAAGTRSQLLRRPRGHTKDNPGVHSPAARPEPPSLSATGPCPPRPPPRVPSADPGVQRLQQLPSRLALAPLSALTGPPATCPPGTAHLAPGTGVGGAGRSPRAGRVHLPPVSLGSFHSAEPVPQAAGRPHPLLRLHRGAGRVTGVTPTRSHIQSPQPCWGPAVHGDPVGGPVR